MAETSRPSDTAYQRLAAAVESLNLDPRSHIRKIALRTLDEMRRQLEHDPAFVDHLVERVHRAAVTAVIEEPRTKLPDS